MTVFYTSAVSAPAFKGRVYNLLERVLFEKWKLSVLQAIGRKCVPPDYMN